MKWNLKEIFEAQKILDNKISTAHNIDSSKIKEKQIIALLVEIGEFANEIQTFKYWKKSKNIDEVKVWEEYADIMHFIASLAIKENLDYNIDSQESEKDLNIIILNLYENISQYWIKGNKNYLKIALSFFLSISEVMNKDQKFIFAEYFKKLDINYKRIVNNY